MGFSFSVMVLQLSTINRQDGKERSLGGLSAGEFGCVFSSVLVP